MERWLQVYNYNNDKCGIVHITIGDGGNQEGLSGLNYQSSTNGQDPLLHCKLLACHPACPEHITPHARLFCPA